MADIFISYAQEERKRITPLVRALAARGWSVFWDMNVPAGQDWRDVLERKLDEASCIVVVWTNTSIKHRWVKEEADEALKQSKYIPVKLDDITVPLGFRSIQVADLASWDGTETSPDLFQILKAIEKFIEISSAEIEAWHGTEEEEGHRAESAKHDDEEDKRLVAEGEVRQIKREQQRLVRKGWPLRTTVFGAFAVLTGVLGFNLLLLDDESVRPPSKPKPIHKKPLGITTACEGADFEGQNLTGRKLAGDNCFRANLRHSTLRDVDLTRTIFVHADLSGADLSRAILDGATMTRANLDGTVLTDAKLNGANLRGVKNLTQEQLDEACGDEQTRLSGNLTIRPCK